MEVLSRMNKHILNVGQKLKNDDAPDHQPTEKW